MSKDNILVLSLHDLTDHLSLGDLLVQEDLAWMVPEEGSTEDNFDQFNQTQASMGKLPLI